MKPSVQESKRSKSLLAIVTPVVDPNQSGQILSAPERQIALPDVASVLFRVECNSNAVLSYMQFGCPQR
jgi:hypothetical protein